MKKLTELDRKMLEKIRVKRGSPHFENYLLYVNGYKLGEHIGGKYKIYTIPLVWAKKQIPKRVKVINRNIKRLEKELQTWKDELIAITYF